MRLRQIPRETISGFAATMAFLGLSFGLGLLWSIALGASLLVYGAMLLVIHRKPEREDDQLSAIDVAATAEALGDAADRLDAATDNAPEADGLTFRDMSEGLRELQFHIVHAPRDYRVARRFLTVFLPYITTTVEGYTRVSHSEDREAEARLADISEQIARFVPAIRRVNRACVDKDLRALETETSTVLQLMERA